MSTKAGALLWNRKRITVQPGPQIIDTGLQQVNRSFGSSSDGEPPLGVVSALPPPAGIEPASRVQVIPLSPISQWQNLSHGEPYVDEATGRVFVEFVSDEDESEIEINVLFWDPHTLVGPGQADTYNEQQSPEKTTTPG